VTSLLSARRVTMRRPPDRAPPQPSPRAPAAQLMTFPPSRDSLKPIGGTNLRPSAGALSEFAAFSYDSREDLPIRAWNGSKGKDGQREKDGPKGGSFRKQGDGKAATEDEIENTPFSQLVRAAAFMKNQEERVSSAAGGERTEKWISGGKMFRKRRLGRELKEQLDRSIGKPAKKKRLAELGDAVGSTLQLQGDVVPGQERQVASPSPLVGFFEKRKEGKRKVKLSKRGEQMDLGSPRRACDFPVADGTERSSEANTKSSEGSAKASKEVRKLVVKAKLGLKNQKQVLKRKRVDVPKGQENPQKIGGQDEDGFVKPSGSREVGTTMERGSEFPPAATSPKVERLGKTRRKVGPPRRWSPGIDGDGSDRENETIRTKPSRDTRLSAEGNVGREAYPEEIGSPRMLHFDGAKEEKESAREQGKRDGILRAGQSEAREEVLRNGSKAEGGDANGPANKEEESEATNPLFELQNGAETGEENGGRVREEQGREGKFAAGSSKDERDIPVTPSMSEASGTG
jgi:hypothetical protein